ncbi:mammalian cell entry protein [Mycolicibacterium sp. A43C]
MWYQLAEGRSAAAHDAELVAAAKQGALNLTTIDYTTVDADIQRILDSSTGAFHDDFQKRSAPFVDAVKRAKSTSTGSVIEAGLQDQHGDQAKVLVAVSVRMVAAEQPDPSPMSWRMQIMVEKAGDEIKMSDVQFVE